MTYANKNGFLIEKIVYPFSPFRGPGGLIFVIFCKGKARIFVSIQRAAIKQRVGRVGFYERCKLACERLWKITLQAAWAAGIADVNARF